MQQLVLYKELIHKIETFNLIFKSDLNSKNTKKWVHYLDPISMYLYGQDYLTFITLNPPIQNSMVGFLEKYYNIFVYIINDLSSLVSLQPADDIYAAAGEIKKTFDMFVNYNRFKIVRNVKNDHTVEKTIFQIFPII